MPLSHPQTLQKLKVPIIDSATCSRLYWRGAGQGAITEDMLCAGYLEGERDACLVSTFLLPGPAPLSSITPHLAGPPSSICPDLAVPLERCLQNPAPAWLSPSFLCSYIRHGENGVCLTPFSGSRIQGGGAVVLAPPSGLQGEGWRTVGPCTPGLRHSSF